VIATLLSRQCGFSAVSLVSRMNLFQFGASWARFQNQFFSTGEAVSHITHQR
jgi:hypothetical protein